MVLFIYVVLVFKEINNLRGLLLLQDLGAISGNTRLRDIRPSTLGAKPDSRQATIVSGAELKHP